MALIHTDTVIISLEVRWSLTLWFARDLHNVNGLLTSIDNYRFRRAEKPMHAISMTGKRFDIDLVSI